MISERFLKQFSEENGIELYFEVEQLVLHIKATKNRRKCYYSIDLAYINFLDEFDKEQVLLHTFSQIRKELCEETEREVRRTFNFE